MVAHFNIIKRGYETVTSSQQWLWVVNAWLSSAGSYGLFFAREKRNVGEREEFMF